MTLHRFFLPAECVGGEHVAFPPDQAHQIRSVLRLQPGDRILVLDNSGSELAVRLDRVDRVVAGTVERRERNGAEPASSVALYQGMLKGSKLELVLQKCTEIGVSSFVPMITARSIPAPPGPARERRFDAIVREAAEQSRRGRLPRVSPPFPFGEALRQAAGGGPIVLLYENGGESHLRDEAIGPECGTVALFVGPEGGFTEEEVDAARAAGARIVTLGRRILRAETAAIVGTALVLARLGDLG